MEPSFTTNARLDEQQHKSTTPAKTAPHLRPSNTISRCRSAEPPSRAPFMNSDGDKGREKLEDHVLGAERMKKHWKEVSVRGVVIPETWGQEAFLKDWTQSSIFDVFVARTKVDEARQALMTETRKTRAAGVKELGVLRTLHCAPSVSHKH